MKRSKAIKIYENNPNVKKVLTKIRGENNWVFNLFDIVDEKVNKFCRASKISADKKMYQIQNSLTLMIFGSLLLKISAAEESEYIFNYIPVKVSKSLRRQAKKSNKGIIIGQVPLDPSDWRPLNEQKVRQAVNEYLAISRIFIHFIDKDRKHNINLISSLVADIRDKQPLPTKIEIMYTKTNLFDSKSFDSIASTTRKKTKAGRKPKFSEAEFSKKIKSIPDKSCKSESEIAEKLGMPGSTFREYIKRYEVDLADILK